LSGISWRFLYNGWMQKRFSEWIKIKEKLDGLSREKAASFEEKEVWWCSIGENVGNEENGKNYDFVRPVLVLTKYDEFNFFAIPLSTKIKKGNWYVDLFFQRSNHVAVVNQGRSLSALRLQNRIGTLDDGDYKKIKAGFGQLHL
jgi:mRNA-degrading endonuclease toxin of MazEF toxin-antitoxin module